MAHSRRRARPRRTAAAAGLVAIAGSAAAAVAAFLLAGGGHAGPRALTPDEADRLAITRFRNYQAGGRAVTITVPGAAGGLVVTASVDYRTKVAYGVVRGTGRDTSSNALIEWTASTVYVHPLASAPALAPGQPPATGWYGRPLRTVGTALDSSLAIALGLGSDRPDNAELLPQNGASWVGGGRVRGHRVDVVTGPRAGTRAGATGAPGTVRYWIGPDGTMYRVRADTAAQAQPVVIDFDTQRYRPVRPLPGVVPTP